MLRFLCAVAVVVNHSFFWTRNLCNWSCWSYLLLLFIAPSVALVGELAIMIFGTACLQGGEDNKRMARRRRTACVQQTLSFQVFSCFYRSKNTHTLGFSAYARDLRRSTRYNSTDPTKIRHTHARILCLRTLARPPASAQQDGEWP